VYWPGLNGGYVFDDYQNLLENPALHLRNWGDLSGLLLSSPSSGMRRPLAMLTFGLNHHFTGFESRPMKLTNLAVHLVNAMLLFALLRRLVGKVAGEERATAAAAFATAAWAVHPINLMVVLYVVQRMEGLCHTFVFLGLLLYFIGRERQMQGRHGAHLILFSLIGCTALGTMAKESAVLLPLYAFMLEALVFRFKRMHGDTDRRLHVVFGVLMLLPAIIGSTWLLIRSLAPGAYASRDFTLYQRLLSQGRALLEYLHWTLLPDLGQLSLYHDDFPISRGWLQPATTAPALLCLAALLGLAYYLRRRRPLVSLGIGWFLGAQLLTATVVPLELMFEHRNYFASAGICLALADLLLLLPQSDKRRHLGVLLAATLLLFFAGTTWLRSSEWSSPLRFAETEARKHPASPRATYEYGRMLVIYGRFDPRSEYSIRALPALEHAMQVPGASALPAQGALMLASRTGLPQRAEWWQDLQDKLVARPGLPENQLSLKAMTDCAVKSYCPFPMGQMVQVYVGVLARHDDPYVMSLYGEYAWRVMQDPELARRLWRESLRLDPRNAQARIYVALVEITQGRYDEAESDIAALRQLGRFGQFDRQADELATGLANAKAAYPTVVNP
jgi:tetratricopeptide (TPR) repeat protein